MKIRFYLRFSTQPGDALTVVVLDPTDGPMPLEMQYLNPEFWYADAPATGQPLPAPLTYYYEFQGADGRTRSEWGPRRSVDLSPFSVPEIHIVDYWNEAGARENVFLTQPFQEVFFGNNPNLRVNADPSQNFTHYFQVQAPLLPPEQSICLLGHGRGLRNWDLNAPLLLRRDGDSWTISLDLSREDFPLGYKYGVWDTLTHTFLGFEQGANRPLYAASEGHRAVTLLNDGFVRLPPPDWRGAGVAIPVFSLRTEKSFGVGEFTDLAALADWAKSVGLKLLQLLPVNDTSAKGAWTDSYPYSAISAFALHPLYLNVAEVAGEKDAPMLKPFSKKQKTLNALKAVDYAAVMATKWEIIRLLFAAQKSAWAGDPDYLAYFAQNRHWLVPYAAFCYLRDKNGTSDFTRWKTQQTYSEPALEKLVDPSAKHHDEVALHYFVQWHLHRQLKAAADYAHTRGLALKGDIPIGIYRYSCDAWVAPELYNMDQQAGAPPDDFAVNGQNWGFPTYNWARMKQDGFAWWRYRFAQMSLYFDAFRIDHILGFFRIWSIPVDAVQGILGVFVPAIPVTEQEFQAAGIGFNYERLCRPFINDAVLQEIFGGLADVVRKTFLDKTADGGHWSGQSPYVLKEAFDTQRKVEAWFENRLAHPSPRVNPSPNPSPEGEGGLLSAISSLSKKEEMALLLADASPLPFRGGVGGGVDTRGGVDAAQRQRLQDGLYALLANVILLDSPYQAPLMSASNAEAGYAFRIEMEKTSSFRYLPEEVKGPLKSLYVNYFFRRQDDFWEQEALEKLPDLKRSTRMLICGEDLGMVPDCVPGVMRELGILSLEIQRMPKLAGATFFNPKDAPYLSVVTPSTHDMSTIRGWWEEDRAAIQRFFNEQLGYEGAAPYYCEPWVARAILAQHFHSPAMWAIFQIQDLLAMDGALRRENPAEERINVPANPTHYWQYRMHISLENLMKAGDFNEAVRSMVMESGRAQQQPPPS